MAKKVERLIRRRKPKIEYSWVLGRDGKWYEVRIERLRSGGYVIHIFRNGKYIHGEFFEKADPWTIDKLINRISAKKSKKKAKRKPLKRDMARKKKKKGRKSLRYTSRGP